MIIRKYCITFALMKRIILSLLIAIGAIAARGADGDLFPYPVPPADMSTLQERCDYLVSHFWDRADIKSAMSKTEKLNSTFGDWIGFMPYASADTVYSAIGRLMHSVRKSGPQALHIARLAENWVYSDTSQYRSEDIFYHFAKAAADNRKIGGADRARFERAARIIDNTRQGGRMRHLTWQTPDGRKATLDTIRTQVILVFFNEHDCDDCSLARVRLSADHNINTLISSGLLTVLCIEPGEPSTEWHVAAAGQPANWVKGACEDADEWFDIKSTPAFYLLDARHKVLAKGYNTDGIIRALAAVRANTGL